MNQDRHQIINLIRKHISESKHPQAKETLKNLLCDIHESTPPPSVEDIAFHRGIIYAAMELIKTHDQPTMALHLTHGADDRLIFELAQREEYDRPLAKLIWDSATSAERLQLKRRIANTTNPAPLPEEK